MTRRNGQVISKGNGKWQIRVSLGSKHGSRRTISVTLNCTRAEADKHLTKLLRERDEGLLLSPVTLTVSEWLDEWLANIVAVNVRRRTYDGYRDMARRYIKPVLGESQVQELRKQDIERWVKHLDRQGLGARSIRLAFSVLHNALSALVESDHLAVNPCTGVKRPKRERAKVTSLTVEQAQGFLQALPAEPLGALWALLLTAAIRPSEALALSWRHVEGGKLDIRHSLSWTSTGPRIEEPKTPQGYRVIPLDPLALQLLENRRSTTKFSSADDLIFCTSAGTPLNQKLLARRHFKPLLKRLGLPAIRMYDLRHTGTTLLLASGITLPLLKERLGHKDAAYLIDTYAHVLPSQQDTATKSLSHLLGTSASHPKKAV